MRIIKNDTRIEIPNWLVVIGVIGVTDIVQMLANASIIKKSNK